MFSWIKKHFIPHSENKHHPYLLRTYYVRSIIALIILIEIFVFLIPALTHLNIKGGMAAVLPAVMASLTNEERESRDLKALQVNSILNKAAEMKAIDMAQNSYFAHTSPLGKTPWYWLEEVGYDYEYAGENLAINFSDSKDVTDAWVASPTHKSNIIKEYYTEVGTGVATGLYEGRETVFVVQVYANPLPKNVQNKSNNKTEVKEKTKVVALEEGNFADVLGVETVAHAVIVSESETIRPTFWQKVLASPRNTTNTILYYILAIISFVLAIYLLLRFGSYQKDPITNGLAVISIVGLVFVMNVYISHHDMLRPHTDTLDYSIETSNVSNI